MQDYDVKIPNFTFYGERTLTSDNDFLFVFQNLSVVPKKLTPGKFSHIWHFQEIGISATKFEKARIHFKSDVFAAVAVVNAKVFY